MSFTRGKPKPANSGRRAGTPNKGSERARRLISEGDDRAIIDAIIRDAKNNDAEARRLYLRHLRPPPPRGRPATPIDLPPPTSAREAQDAIAKVTSMIARCEIDGEHGSRVIAGLKEYRDGRAAELEALYEKDKMSGGEP